MSEEIKPACYKQKYSAHIISIDEYERVMHDNRWKYEPLYSAQSIRAIREEARKEAIDFAVWVELEGYRIKGMDDGQRDIIYNMYLTNLKNKTEKG